MAETDKERVGRESRERHKRIVSLGPLEETCAWCNCLLDGTIYHDCKEGKVKHLCLDLTKYPKPKKEKTDVS